jgi:uncharacterized membrane protein
VGEDDERGYEPAGGYGVGRLLAFSDGVFAIAITLLVLTLPVPDVPKTVSDSALLDALGGLGPNLAALALSFFLITTQWITHHRLLAGVRRVFPRLLMLNSLVLFFVCVLPFSTSLIVRYGSHVPAVEVYTANLALLQAAVALMALVLAAGGQLPRRIVVNQLVIACGFLLALLLVPVLVWFGYAAAVLAGASVRILDVWRRTRQPNSTET